MAHRAGSLSYAEAGRAVIVAPGPDRGPTRWSTAVVTTLLLTVLLVCCGMPVATSLRNEARLIRFAGALCDHERPREIDFNGPCTREMGLLAGNGNHCDYQAAVTLISRWPRERIIRHYDSVRFPSVSGDRDIEPTLYFEEPNIGRFQVFIVEIYEHGQPAGLDLRCN